MKSEKEVYLYSYIYLNYLSVKLTTLSQKKNYKFKY